ncbi:MAG: hypothetical protein QOE54_7127 [Streptosporangiaceae bacterium]|jgi:hypothetical protein|nr:hypothetical protein [Streptosporangiaceae bacterium]MDX6434761.1 hypothetical protein [Streptosporangiaceae bacterium]
MWRARVATTGAEVTLAVRDIAAGERTVKDVTATTVRFRQALRTDSAIPDSAASTCQAPLGVSPRRPYILPPIILRTSAARNTSPISLAQWSGSAMPSGCG